VASNAAWSAVPGTPAWPIPIAEAAEEISLQSIHRGSVHYQVTGSQHDRFHEFAPHQHGRAACLVARDLGEDGPDMQRRFDFVLSHDRDLVISVATR
jgi:hypothetical protein